LVLPESEKWFVRQFDAPANPPCYKKWVFNIGLVTYFPFVDIFKYIEGGYFTEIVNRIEQQKGKPTALLDGHLFAATAMVIDESCASSVGQVFDYAWRCPWPNQDFVSSELLTKRGFCSD
jgi:hypothetical protein